MGSMCPRLIGFQTMLVFNLFISTNGWYIITTDGEIQS